MRNLSRLAGSELPVDGRRGSLRRAAGALSGSLLLCALLHTIQEDFVLDARAGGQLGDATIA
ncbi:MAG: hypothetical protein LC790_01275 [Actinobacteria bacterium]|nr:hypothetical protein [Actinomycetota bacterium]